MATKSTTLFSLAAIKAYLDIQSGNAGKDAVIEAIADGVSEKVEKITGRIFVTREVTETLDARGRQHVRLANYPIASVTSVRRRADMSSAWETIDAGEYELDARLGIVHLKALWFWSGPRTCEVTYQAGFDEQDGAGLPADLVMLAKEYCKFVWTRWQAGMIIAGSMGVGSQSVTVVPEPPRDVRDGLKAWQKLRL